MAKFKQEFDKKPVFNPIGVRRFRFSQQAQDKISHWLHSAITDNLMRWFLILWIIPLIGTIVFSLIHYSSLPDEIPLFYSRRWGEAQLAPKNYLFIPTSGTFLLGIFNFCLGISLHSRWRVLAYLLSGAAFAIAFMTAITSVKIILLML